MNTAITFARSSSISQRLMILCIIYFAVVTLTFHDTLSLVAGQYPVFRFFVFFPVVLLAGVVLAIAVNRPRSPFAFVREKISERGAGAAITFGTLILATTAFTTLKHEYAKHLPFFGDPVLAALDRALHFGDPWAWTHAVLPEVLAYPLFVLYSILWFIELLLAVSTAAFLSNQGLRERYLATFTIGAMILSSVIRVAASSAGPIFYDRIHGGSRFAGLISALKESGAGARALEVSSYLHTSYATDTTVLGTGIAAMPSLHVALAFLNALLFARLGRVCGVLGWSYFAAILFGSVYFGWHYALDGYVSIAVMLGLWTLFGRLEREADA